MHHSKLEGHKLERDSECEWMVVQVWWWCSGRLTQRIALVVALMAENRSGFPGWWQTWHAV